VKSGIGARLARAPPVYFIASAGSMNFFTTNAL
jgi:hypothetical protein